MTDIANNVLSFPKINPRENTPRNNVELQADFDENKRVYVDQVVEHYSTQLINKLGLHGFDIYKPEFITTYSYTIETLRACLYQSIDLYHPFKDHIEEITEELEIEGLDDDFD